jgi:hypothetical protein
MTLLTAWILLSRIDERMSVECWWNNADGEETKVLEGKPVQVPLVSKQILLGLDRYRTWASALGNMRLTA